MIVLDENIPSIQRELLASWGLALRQIGVDIGTKGIQDDEVIVRLRALRHATFVTRDAGFYSRKLRHPECCLVVASVEQSEIALFVRRFLRHPEFNTQAKRAGTVIRVSRAALTVIGSRSYVETRVVWGQATGGRQ